MRGKTILIVGETSSDAVELNRKLVNLKGCKTFLAFGPIGENELGSQIDQVEIVVITSKAQNRSFVIDKCIERQKEVLVVPNFIELLNYSAEPRVVDDILTLSLKPPGLNKSQRLLKRFFDVMVALIMLILAAPVMIWLMLVIPLTSQGPAIFSQERIGENGRPFKVLKFRTMVNNAEQATGPVLAVQKDPRVTRFGVFLRATRLDELPQLVNVLYGDMSIVGPRPERKFFIEQFKSIPTYTYRHTVKPGITGLAQVKGKYSTTAQDKLRFDLMYIQNYSFGLDLKILLETILVVLHANKAEGVNVYSDNLERKAASN